MSTRELVTVPSFWAPRVLDQLIRHCALDFQLAQEPIALEEMTHALGYGAVLAFLINARVPGSIPLVSHPDSACGWQARYEDVQRPVTIIGGAALDVLHELREAVAPSHTVRVEPLCYWMTSILVPENPLLALFGVQE